MSAAPHLPTLLQGVNLKALPLEPREAFVLSRIDGYSGPREISLGTGLPESDVREILYHLAELGAIRYEEASPASSSSAKPAPPSSRIPQKTTQENRSEVRGVASDDLATATTIRAPEPPPRKPGHPPELFLEVNDLPAETRVEILDFESRVDRYTHYELLHIPETAEKKAIKAAYFDLVNRFHTDRFFGKELGSFKPRLEKIFRALTKAHDTLTKLKLREEYDRYLASRQVTRGLRDSLPPSSSPPDAAENVPLIPQAPRALTLEDFADVDSTPTKSARVPDQEAARRLLAKKFGLRGSQDPPPDTNPVASPEVDRDSVRKMVDEHMRARFDARNSVEGQISNYIAMAEEARGRKAYGPALNAIKTALAVAPQHVEAIRLHREIQDEADRELADQFAEQAKYEEADGHLARAARSYERAARGKRSATLYDRAANCLLAAHGDKRKTVELARNAVTTDGNSAAFRLTLAKAYDFAGMRTSAIGELNRALEIDPKLTDAKNLLKQLK